MKKKEIHDEIISIYDIACCAALISAGFPIAGFNKDNPQKVEFVFLKTEKLEKAYDDYFKDALKVNPRSFNDNIKMLKTKIYGY